MVNSPESHLDQHEKEVAKLTFQYDAFISYSTGSDYAQARKIESFLESFHKSFKPAGVSLKQMHICRDGSDFRLPAKRENAVSDDDPIWNIIVGELAKSRYLIVLCSPESTRSVWVDKEIAWMMKHHGAGSILPVLTNSNDPVGNPHECFPSLLRDAGLHKARLWYDLRSFVTTSSAAKVRVADDELVRLASDLLDWDSSQYGPLAPLWLREQLKKRRRQAVIAIAIAAVLVGAAIVTIWRSVVASREADRARANAIVLAADSSTDPLTGALLLSELQDYDDPDDGTRVAQRLGSLILPTALMRGHTGRLVKVAFSPNQTRVLTASNDGTARLWPIDGKGDPIILRGHTDALTDAQFSSDGSLIVTASKDKTARIWAESGNEAVRVFQHITPVLSAQFSFDNEWLATVSELGFGQLWSSKGHGRRSLSPPDNNTVVRIWLSRTNPGGWVVAGDATVWSFQYDSSGTLSFNQALGTAKEQDDYFPDYEIDKVTFSPNGSHVAVVFQNKALVRRIDNKAAVVLAHDDWVNSVDFNQDGTQIVTSCSDGKVRLWSTETGQVSKTLDVKVRYFVLDLSGQKPSREDTAMRAQNARFSHNGSRIVALFEDGVIRIWNVGYDGDTTELRGSAGADIASFSLDDTQLITGADDGTARVWPLSPPTEPFVFRHSKAVDAATLSEDGQKVATGSRDGITHVWQMSDPQRRIELKAGEGAVKGVAFDKLGTQLATAQDSGTVNLWEVADINNPKLKKQFRRVVQKFSGVQFSSDGRRLLAWAHGGNAYVWSINGNEESILDVYQTALWYAEFDPNGGRVVTAYDEGTVRVWNADGSGRYVTLEDKIWPTATTYRARFSPDGSRVLTVSEDGRARLWNSDGTDREPVRIVGPNPAKDDVENCAFSPDGKKFVITTSAGRAWVFPANGQGPPTVLRSVADLAHIGSIMAVAFSRDSNRIVTGGGVDGKVYVWQADGSGKPMALVGHQGTISWAGFNTDGSRIITASEDGSTRIWRTSWHDLISYLRTLTSASLTPEQRIIYLGESEDAARAAYEQEERRFGRTPLPANWQFSYPF